MLCLWMILAKTFDLVEKEMQVFLCVGGVQWVSVGRVMWLEVSKMRMDAI